MEDKAFLYSYEFAQQFNLTRQALIYYDKIGLFKPYTTSQSGYRLYAREQNQS